MTNTNKSLIDVLDPEELIECCIDGDTFWKPWRLVHLPLNETQIYKFLYESSRFVIENQNVILIAFSICINFSVSLAEKLLRGIINLFLLTRKENRPWKNATPRFPKQVAPVPVVAPVQRGVLESLFNGTLPDHIISGDWKNDKEKYSLYRCCRGKQLCHL